MRPHLLWLALGAGCGAGSARPAAPPPGELLAPCPASPNCVSSLAPPDDATHAIAPLPDAPLEAVLALLEQDGAELIVAEPVLIHAVYTTRLLRFRDDLTLARADGVWHVRSASRLGYGDLGVNRRRVESLRARW